MPLKRHLSRTSNFFAAPNFFTNTKTKIEPKMTRNLLILKSPAVQNSQGLTCLQGQLGVPPEVGPCVQWAQLTVTTQYPMNIIYYISVRSTIFRFGNLVCVSSISNVLLPISRHSVGRWTAKSRWSHGRWDLHGAWRPRRLGTPTKSWLKYER